MHMKLSEQHSERPAGSDNKSSAEISWLTLGLSGGFFIAFVIVALVDIDFLSYQVGIAYAISTKLFGVYWQVLLLATFTISLYVALSRSG